MSTLHDDSKAKKRRDYQRGYRDANAEIVLAMRVRDQQVHIVKRVA